MAVDKAHHFLYTVNSSAGDFSIFYIGIDGSLVPVNLSITTVANPRSVIVDAADQNLYVSGDFEVARYPINADGSLAAPTITPTAAAGSVIGADYQGRYLLTTSPTRGMGIAKLNPNGAVDFLSVVSNPQGDGFFDATGGAVFVNSNGALRNIRIAPDASTTETSLINFSLWPSFTMNAARTNAYVLECGSDGYLYYHPIVTDMGGVLVETTPKIQFGPSTPGWCLSQWAVSTIDETGRYLYVIPYTSSIGYQFRIGLDGSLSLLESPTFGPYFPFPGGQYFLSVFGIVAVQY
jgi:hypothetical protein